VPKVITITAAAVLFIVKLQYLQ